MTVACIDAHEEEFGVEPICEQLQVTPSTHYAARTRPPLQHSVIDAVRTALISSVHSENCGVHGSQEVHAELVQHLATELRRIPATSHGLLLHGSGGHRLQHHHSAQLGTHQSLKHAQGGLAAMLAADDPTQEIGTAWG